MLPACLTSEGEEEVEEQFLTSVLSGISEEDLAFFGGSCFRWQKNLERWSRCMRVRSKVYADTDGLCF